jgi:hypothetical protein
MLLIEASVCTFDKPVTTATCFTELCGKLGVVLEEKKLLKIRVSFQALSGM